MGILLGSVRIHRDIELRVCGFEGSGYALQAMQEHRVFVGLRLEGSRFRV